MVRIIQGLRLTALDFTLYGGAFFWNFAPLILMVGAGIGSEVLKEKYKED
ncbi:hypothetical protein [Desulfoscipio sp. XC116]